MEMKFSLITWVWPIDTKLGVLVADIKMQLGRPRCLRSRSTSLLLHKQIQLLLLNLSLCVPIDTNRRRWVAYTKMQLGIATQMFVLKVKITAVKIEIQLLRYSSFY